MNTEGYPFRARRNRPRRMTEDDIRRIVANWDKYGGLVTYQRSKDRKAYEEFNPGEIVFNEERAVFPVDLLRRVAKVRHERSARPLDDGKPREAKFYPLSQLTYCAHCEKLVDKYGDLSYRTTLTGTFLNGKPKYRHKAGVKCGCQRRTVPCELIEQDFERLIKLLTVSPDNLDKMTALAIETDRAMQNGDIDPEKEKAEAIGLCKRRIQAAVDLFSDGVIDREEYLRRREKNEREMAYWQARTTETEKAALELGMCLEAVDTIARIWNIQDDEDRQGMVRNLFSYLVYDFDTQRITDFRLKAWADRFLVLRAALYEEQVIQRDMPHTGLEDISRFNISRAVAITITRLYPSAPEAIVSPIKAEWNNEIRRLYADGASIGELARAFGSSKQRVDQIIKGKRK